MLANIARWCVRRRRVVVFGIWLPLLIVLAGASGAIGSNFRTDFTLPDSEAADVQQMLAAANPDLAGDTAQIVYRAPDGVRRDAVRAPMEELFADVDDLADVAVVSPYTAENQVSDDGTIAYARLNVADLDLNEMLELSQEIQDRGDRLDVAGVSEIEYGGQLFATFEFPEAELLGIVAAVIILILAFGSVLAMGLPIGTALFGLGVGTSIVGLLSYAFSMPDFTTQMVAMIGLGVGIDYALFIVTRYREGLHRGLSVENAIVESIDTAGRSVLFAGITVIISLLGLYVVGLGFVRGLATGAAVGVLMMMLGSITLLPSLLAMVGTRIGTTSRAALVAVGLAVFGTLAFVVTGTPVLALAGGVAAVALYAASFSFRGLRTPLPPRAEKPAERTFWYRWSRFVQRRPWPVLIGAAGALVLLAIPLFSIRLGFGDTGNLPEHQTARKAYDLLAEGFGDGISGPLIVTVEGEAASDPATLQRFGAALTDTDGVQFAAPPQPVSDGLALVTVFPDSSPQDEATTELVERLRQQVIPDSGLTAHVGGFTAAAVDFSSYLGSRLPVLIGSVLVLSYLLLMAVFRSVLVPLKAVVLNLLSIGAAYGVLVAIFQFGWGMQLIGVGRAGPIEAWAPMMLFAIVFGLSMDYEVFLLSRMKEEYDRTGDNSAAVVDGLTLTARVITAAALIMVCVFSAFALGDDRQLKLFGLGMAIAVGIDATVVRMLLVPATMELLGHRNWWMPGWLDRMLPSIAVEGHLIEEPEAERGEPEEPGEAGEQRQPELV